MLSKITLYQKNLLIAFLISLAVAVLFLFWSPSQEYDLFQYFKWMDLARLFRPEETLNFFLSRGEPIFTSYLFMIAKTGLYGFLQFFPTILTIFIIQFIPINYCKRKNISYKLGWFAIFVFFGMYEIFLIPSGIRSSLGFAVFALALYLDLYLKNKKLSTIFYLVSPLIHLGLIIPISIRFLLKLKLRNILVIAACILLPVLAGAGPFLASMFSGGVYDNIFTANLYKLGNYLTPFAPISFAYFYKILKLLIILFGASFLYVIDKKDLFTKYVFLLAIFTTAFLPVYFMWYRLLELLVILFPILIINYFTLKKINLDFRKYIAGLLFIVAIVGWRVEAPYYLSGNFDINDSVPTNSTWREYEQKETK